MRLIQFVALTLFTASASALDAGALVANLKNRRLEPGSEGLEHVMCLLNSMDNILGSVSMTFALLGEAVEDESISTICPNGFGDCDLSQTDMAAQVTEMCVENGGKIVEESLYMCKDFLVEVESAIVGLMGLFGAESEEYYNYLIEELGTALATIEEVKLTGIPICLHPECSDEVDVTSTLAAFIEATVSQMLVEEVFDEEETAIVDSILGLVTGLLNADECAPISLADEMCIDSPARMSVNGKSKGCNWVGMNPDKLEDRCKKGVIASHCPKTCGQCDAFKCADSKKKFILPTKNGKEKQQKKCGWVANKDTVERCQMPGVLETCKETCGFCP
jgi:hypothetical protein